MRMPDNRTIRCGITNGVFTDVTLDFYKIFLSIMLQGVKNPRTE